MKEDEKDFEMETRMENDKNSENKENKAPLESTLQKKTNNLSQIASSKSKPLSQIPSKNTTSIFNRNIGNNNNINHGNSQNSVIGKKRGLESNTSLV